MIGEAGYFDTSYLVRLYLDDPGCTAVRQLARGHRQIACASHGRAEVIAAFHRAFRDGRLTAQNHELLHQQFVSEMARSVYLWHPLDDAILRRMQRVYRTAPAKMFLRAADALHLACAAEHGFTEVYSHDRHFLAAAPYFDLIGHDVI